MCKKFQGLHPQKCTEAAKESTAPYPPSRKGFRHTLPVCSRQLASNLHQGAHRAGNSRPQAAETDTSHFPVFLPSLLQQQSTQVPWLRSLQGTASSTPSQEMKERCLPGSLQTTMNKGGHTGSSRSVATSPGWMQGQAIAIDPLPRSMKRQREINCPLLTSQRGAGSVALLQTPTSHTAVFPESQLSCFWFSFLLMCLGRQWVMAQVLKVLPLTWET